MKLHGMGLADDTTDSGFSDITSSVKDIITAYNQQQILQANIDLAKQGKPLIDTRQLAPTYNVGLSPDIKNLLIIGGVVLLAIMLLNGRRG